MTHYEALDLAQSTFSNSLAAYAIFLSIVSGYLITAYLVGSELSRIQVRLLTLLFLIVAAILIWSMSAYAYWGDAFSTVARGENRERTFMTAQSWLPAFLAVINSLTVIGCIFFMWNVRHTKRADKASR
jgi:hypothetical protein